MEDIDWDSPHFNNGMNFQDALGTESPYNPFSDFTNLDQQYDANSPGMTMRTPSKSGAVPQQGFTGLANGPSAESSSQDSASDSSSRRKRKVSESPSSDPSMETGVKQEDAMMEMGHVDSKIPPQYVEQYPTRPMHDLSLDQDGSMFGFNSAMNSAASSPAQARDYGAGMSLNRQIQHGHPPTTMAQQYQQSPVSRAYEYEARARMKLTCSQIQTINPGMFQLNASRDQSPITNNMMFNNASPNALFSSASSTSEETYGNQQTWNAGNMVQNPAWPQNFDQFTSPGGGLGFTPSPIVNGATPSVASRGSAGSTTGRSPLHIAPISTKSRVETQINVIMTLEKPPPGIEHLHLPLHTIAKSKLLAKEEFDKSKTLELHTMLVCTSAMQNPQHRQKALARAAAQNNAEIQRRAELARQMSDDEKNDMKNVEEADKPANGGEVRICNNCIQRERKRAGRKKLKKEEEQQHWERFETERVVVFNSNEYLPFKSPEETERPHQHGGFPGAAFQEGAQQQRDSYTPPDGSVQVVAAMRVACYCRHQSEKEGFQVIFTLKDQAGNVVAQQMSDSILITDDHKTHPPTYGPTTLAGGGEMYYQPHTAAAFAHGLPMSQSMVDLQSHAYPFTSSRSTGNLAALGAAYAGHQQFNPHSHVHQLPPTTSASGYNSQATSATMTPTSMSRPASRPGSPMSVGQAGPNKKRKSSSFHRKMPSGLTMTPARPDASQPPSAGLPSAALSSVTSPFSPTGDGNNTGFGQQGSYMTIPTNSGPAQYYGSGPPTPSENQHQPFPFTQAQIEQHLARAQNAQAYFSHPSSAVPSRASSPVLQLQQPPPGRGNMAAYARQQQAQGVQTPGGGMMQQQQQARQQQQVAQHSHQANAQSAQYASTGMQMQQNNQAQAVGGSEQDNTSPPTITKITPADGPYLGGTEVSIYGYNFTNGTQVMFGDKVAVTVFYGPQALLATSPPSRPGGVNVTLVPPNGQQGSAYQSPPVGGNRQIFTYTDQNPRMMEMALRFMSQQQTGSQVGWGQLASSYATQYLSTNVSRAGIGNGQQGYDGGGGGGNTMAGNSRRPSLQPTVSYDSTCSWTTSGAPNIHSAPPSRRPSAIMGLPTTVEEGAEPTSHLTGSHAPEPQDVGRGSDPGPWDLFSVDEFQAQPSAAPMPNYSERFRGMNNEKPAPYVDRQSCQYGEGAVTTATAVDYYCMADDETAHLTSAHIECTPLPSKTDYPAAACAWLTACAGT